MSFDKISFEHWYIETKDIMEHKWFTFISPQSQTFYKSENIYLALTFTGNEAYVNMVIGKESNNVAGFRRLIKECQNGHIKFLRFGTFGKNKRMLALYRYCGAKFVKEITNSYADGDSYVEYLLDLNAPRFIKKD